MLATLITYTFALLDNFGIPSEQRAPLGLLLFMIAGWVIVALRVWWEYHKPQSLRV